jgi:ATP-dependent DNA helicase PIF1
LDSLFHESKGKMQTLTEEQQKAYQAVCSGKSIFLTGPGGTGKSFLLRFLYENVPQATGKQVAITAMTGCAALLIGGFAKTLHSWAGIGLGRDPPMALAAFIRRSGRTLRRWLGTDILVIDEVSMLTPELLEKLDQVARILRKCNEPMGGLQIVFVGDFYQLPPVNKDKEKETQFVFESPLWKTIVKETVHLTQILRQDDPVFQKILGEARYGTLSEESLQILARRQDRSWQQLQIKPTLLFTRRAEVDNINDRNLRALQGERKLFKAETVFQPIEQTKGLTESSPGVKQAIEKLDRDGQYMVELVLALGAQVMLLVNLDHEAGLVNGSRGVVTGFEPSGTPLVKFKTGAEIPISASTWHCEDLEGVGRKQIPLKLAYAITIHKAQGATLDCALIDIGTSTFEYGQAYVALSRVKNLESLYVWDIEPTAFKTHPKVQEFYQNLI